MFTSVQYASSLYLMSSFLNIKTRTNQQDCSNLKRYSVLFYIILMGMLSECERLNFLQLSIYLN